MKPRPTGHRYECCVTTDDGSTLTVQVGDYSVHEAMRRAKRATERLGLDVANVTGRRLTPKRRRRTGSQTVHHVTPIDWDAIAQGRHGLHVD